MAKNTANLRKGHLNKEQAQEYGRMGGVASGRVRRAKRMFREMLAEALEVEIPGEDGKLISRKLASCIILAKMMAGGDLRAIDLGTKLLGEAVEQHAVDIVTARDLTPDEAADILRSLDKRL